MTDDTVARILSSLPAAPTHSDYRASARDLVPYIREQVPPMAGGHTGERLGFLMEVARQDLGLARLIEGHLDALQILGEAGMAPARDALYGVWASGGPADSVQISKEQSSDQCLTGSKAFCSGADIVDHALVYVYPEDQLMDVDLRAGAAHGQVVFDNEHWQAPAFRETHTWTVGFDGLLVGAVKKVGSPKWYFERPGFAIGALAPAACWAGGALGLVDSVRQRTLKGPHAKAHLGAMVCAVQSMQAMLRWGAYLADDHSGNADKHMFAVALMVRHHIERASSEILDRFGRTLGPRPYAFEADSARRIAELTLYLRQCHAESDLQELGEHLEASPGFPGSLL